MRLLQSISGKRDKHIWVCPKADADWALEVNHEEREKGNMFYVGYSYYKSWRFEGDETELGGTYQK